MMHLHQLYYQERSEALPDVVRQSEGSKGGAPHFRHAYVLVKG